MIETKFKFWDTHKKVMVQWEKVMDNKEYVYDFLRNVIGNLVPLQYIGRSDKKGVEIYERNHYLS